MTQSTQMPTMNDQEYIDGKGPPFLPRAPGIYALHLKSFFWKKGFRSQGFFALVDVLESDHPHVKVGRTHSIMFETGQTDELQKRYRASELRQFHAAMTGEDPATLDLDARNRESVAAGEDLALADLKFRLIVRLQKNKDGTIKNGRDGQPFTNTDFRQF